MQDLEPGSMIWPQLVQELRFWCSGSRFFDSASAFFAEALAGLLRRL